MTDAPTNPNPNPAPPAMPTGLPEQFWDATANTVKVDDLVKSYGEVATFKSEHDARLAALPQKADDYQLELKLPDGFKLPEGYATPKLDDKDPRLPALRQFALENKIDPAAINKLVSLDAQWTIAAHIESEKHFQAEMAKLGENGKARVGAVESFMKAHVSKEEYEAMRPFISDATAFAGIEKLMQKALTQGVPPHKNPDPPTPPPQSIEQRWYGNGSAQQRAN